MGKMMTAAITATAIAIPAKATTYFLGNLATIVLCYSILAVEIFKRKHIHSIICSGAGSVCLYHFVILLLLLLPKIKLYLHAFYNAVLVGKSCDGL
jgi:hydrogenase-4 membrane subunit HyfE